MESFEARIERLEYYQQLMIELVELEKWPFHQLIMKCKLTEQEVLSLFNLCEELNEEYKKQKAEGFVGFSPLLVIFRQKLNYKLAPLEVILALEQENYFPHLMAVLKKAVMDEYK